MAVLCIDQGQVEQEPRMVHINNTISAELLNFEKEGNKMLNFPYEFSQGPLPGFDEPSTQDRRNCRCFLECKSYEDDAIMLGGLKTQYPSVMVQSAKTLGPGMWLNDETIIYFLMDLKLNYNQPKVVVFDSFFLSKLMELNEDTKESYNYENVREWGGKVMGGKHPKEFDKLVFIFNERQTHWITIVLFTGVNQVESFDSLGGNTQMAMIAVLRWLHDEHEIKWKSTPEGSSWKLVSGRCLAFQPNGFDCGVYTILIMMCVLLGKDLRILTDEFMKNARTCLLTKLLMHSQASNFDLKFDLKEMDTESTDYSKDGKSDTSKSPPKDNTMETKEVSDTSIKISNVARRILSLDSNSGSDDKDEDKKKMPAVIDYNDK